MYFLTMAHLPLAAELVASILGRKKEIKAALNIL